MRGLILMERETLHLRPLEFTYVNIIVGLNHLPMLRMKYRDVRTCISAPSIVVKIHLECIF